MAHIHLLDQNTINKIAAGEVVERPAAVVKELTENAIDAGANAVTVEIKEGGISFIRITDNGSGIEKDEIRNAFLRHATSKIKTVEDLLSVKSLGFRGEALSSVSSVSQTELVTKIPGALNGVRYVIEGGMEKEMEEIGCPEGTTFIVRNLFFNTPARRKFLKTPMTEAGYISELMERLAISHPDVSFKFIVNGQIKLHTSGNKNLKDIIYNVYGREIAANLLEVHGRTDHMELAGFIGKPVVSRGNRNYMNCFINGRYIKSPVIAKAVEEAYKPYTMTHRYPFTALHLQIPQEFIDVNVHPTKMEIRFKNSEEVYALVYHTLKEGLAGKEFIPDVTLVEEKAVRQEKIQMPEPFEKNRLKEFQKAEEHLNKVKTINSTEVEHNKPSAVIQSNHAIPTGPSMPSGTSLSSSTFATSSHRGTDTKGPAVRNRLYEYNQSGMPTQESKEIIKETEIGKLQEIVENPVFASAHSMVVESPNYGVTATPGEMKTSQEAEQPANSAASSLTTDNMDKEKDLQATQMNLFEDHILSEQGKKELRILGQLFSTYWIVEFRDKMFIIDQHAAHEKVLYEKTLQSIREREHVSQMIHPPLILTLNMREEETLHKHMDVLYQLGFEIESFGGREYSVRAVPNDMLGIAQKELLIELIDTLVDDSYSENVELILEKVASMSCKAAVKGNHKLSALEAEALIGQLLELDNPYHCPHGRPTIISMSKYEIEKKFKRIV